MRKTLLCLFCCLCSMTAFLQTDIDIRTLVIKSDVVLIAGNLRTDSLRPLTDYSYESYSIINQVDSLVKTDGRFSNRHYTLRNSLDGQDYFSAYNNASCLVAPKIWEERETYTNLLFLIKEGKQYRVLRALQDISYGTAMNFVSQVLEIQELESIKIPEQRLTKTLDWFIRNGKLPDYNFLQYYKQKGLIKDSVIYTEEQYKSALEYFLTGKELLADILVPKYRNEVKAYYLQQLSEYSAASGKEWKDYYTCYQVVTRMVNLLAPIQEGEDYYDRLVLVLAELLTKDYPEIDNYYKDKVLNQLVLLLEKV
jgi:hypothetical protein